MARRRQVLATAALGLGGGAVGYSQRRRLRRLPEHRELGRVRAIPLPETPEAFAVPADHLEASRTRLDSLIGTARELGLSAEPNESPSIAPAVRARDVALDADSSVRTLSFLRVGRRRAAQTIEWYRYESGDRSASAAERDVREFQTRLDRTALAYTLAPDGLLVGDLHAAERAVDAARGSLRAARRRVIGRSRPTTNGHVEAARAHLELATALAGDGDGPSRKAQLRERADRLQTAIADRTSEAPPHVDVEYVRARSSRGFDPNGLLGGPAADASEATPASAVAVRLRDLALARVVAESGANVAREVSDFSLGVADVDAAKRDAAEALGQASSPGADEPLRRLCYAFAASTAERGDEYLADAAESVNGRAGAWLGAQQNAYLSYRAAAETARLLPALPTPLD